MSYPPKGDEAKFNETLKRLLKSPPKPHKKGAEPEPDASRSDQEKDHKRERPKTRG